MSRLVPINAVVLLCFAVPLPAVEPLPKEVAFSIDTYVRVTLDYGFMQQEESTIYLGSSVCVSPDGYIITNVHVADPGVLITKLVLAASVLPKGIANVYLQYRICNKDNLTFTTDYKPEVEYERRERSFQLHILKLESRPDAEEDRAIHIIKRNDQDVMIIKLDHDMPLPYLPLPPILPASSLTKSESPAILYALAARKDEKFDVVAVTRIGQTNNSAATIVCQTLVTPITMTTIEGDSGSIIIDSRHRPVGLLASHELPEVSDVSFMIPIDRVTEFYNTVISEINLQKENVLVEVISPTCDREQVHAP